MLTIVPNRLSTTVSSLLTGGYTKLQSTNDGTMILAMKARYQEGNFLIVKLIIEVAFEI